ncbi:S26 family signal peptidase [Actinomadura sp. NTSP31]|uniref:S26 family signal peptidase n=1 Tax=Actinomadura sp. NTSP31 TaxID=1735447 RepID=UPI0035BF4E42
MSNTRGRLLGGAGLVAAGALVAVGWARSRLVVVTVDGTSMLPTLRDGDRVLARRRPLDRVRRGDVVVLEPPSDGPYLPGPAGSDGPVWNVKRVAALPGDPVPPGITGEGGTVPDGSLVVLGDNPDSVDSRQRGPYPADRLLGVVVRRLGITPAPSQGPAPWQKAPTPGGP